MGDELVSVVEELKGNKDVRAVILTGAGNAFSAGGDLKFLQARIDTQSPQANNRCMRNFYARFLSVRQLRVPVIAAINGCVCVHMRAWIMCFGVLCVSQMTSISHQHPHQLDCCCHRLAISARMRSSTIAFAAPFAPFHHFHDRQRCSWCGDVPCNGV